MERAGDSAERLSDVSNGAVETTPKPQIVHTYQAGSVYRTNRSMIDGDFCYSGFQNACTSYVDPADGNDICPAAGRRLDYERRGAGGERVAGRRLQSLSERTAGSAKYSATNLWAANAPNNTEAIGLTWRRGAGDAAFFEKRIGRMYNDNGTANQAILIDPWNVTNAYVNCTFRDRSFFRETKVRLAANNVFDEHYILGVTPRSANSSLPSGGDRLTLMPGRSLMLSLTAGVAPRR